MKSSRSKSISLRILKLNDLKVGKNMEMARVQKLRNIPEVLLDWAKTSWIDKIDWIIKDCSYIMSNIFRCFRTDGNGKCY